MKIKVKIEETRVVVTNKDDIVMSIWSNSIIEDAGGLQLCIDKYKEANPKAEIEVIGTIPTTTPVPEATTPVPEATTPVPEATTPVPEATTPVPEATTPAPEATTPAPAV